MCKIVESVEIFIVGCFLLYFNNKKKLFFWLFFLNFKWDVEVGFFGILVRSNGENNRIEGNEC